MKKMSLPRMFLVTSLGFTSLTHAAFIDGSIQFSTAPGGSITFLYPAGTVDPTLADVTGVTSWSNGEVDIASGSFASVPLATAVIFSQSWVFNPTTPTAPLWTVINPTNSEKFTFNLNSSFIERQTARSLLITGTGTLTGDNFDDTPGTWRFSTQGSGTPVNFSWSSTTMSVFDGGSTVALFGGSLLGLCGLRRFRSCR